jgi:hypothetical protein
VLLLFQFLPKSSINSSSLLCVLHVLYQLLRFRHSNNIWRGVDVVKFLITKFSSGSFYFLSLRATYSSQHLVLKQLQSVLPLLG